MSLSTYAISVRVVKGLQLYNVGMTHDAHDLQLAILLKTSAGGTNAMGMTRADLETLVLKNALDGSIFARRRELGLEDNSKRTVAHNLALGILHLLGLTCQAILDLLTNNLY